MTKQVGTYEAKTRLPELIRLVQSGQRITITNRGEPVAELVPVGPRKGPDVSAAIDAFLAFKAAHPVKRGINVRALIEDGRA